MRLLILQDGSSKKSFPIGKSLTIGKADGNSIQITGDDASDKHAKVAVVGPYVFIEDLDTRAGTLVNGTKITRTALKKGDKIKVASVFLVYDEDDQPEPKPGSKRKPSKKQAPAVAKPSDSSRQNTNQRSASKKIKLSGASLGGPQPPGSSSRNSTVKKGSTGRMPAVASGGAPRGSSSGNPSVRPGQARGSSTRNRAVRAGASGSRMPGLGSSSRSASINISAKLSQVEAEANKALTNSKKAAMATPTKMTGAGIMGMIALLVMILLAIFIIPHIRSYMQENEKVDSKEQTRREALERLKAAKQKDLKDVKLIAYKLKIAKKWSEVEELLGDPPIKDTQTLLLWEEKKGSFQFPGDELRAYPIFDPLAKDSASVIKILLFDVDEDDEVTFLGTKRHALRETPPMVIEKPEDPEDTKDDPTKTTPTASSEGEGEGEGEDSDMMGGDVGGTEDESMDENQNGASEGP